MITNEQWDRLLRDIERATEPPAWLRWLFYVALFTAGLGAGMVLTALEEDDE